MHPKFPLENSPTCSAEGPSAAECHAIAFSWDRLVTWKWLHLAKVLGPPQMSVDVIGVVFICTQGLNQFLPTVIVLFHCIVLSMSQGFLVEIRADFKIQNSFQKKPHKNLKVTHH